MAIPIDRAPDPKTSDYRIKVNRPISERNKKVFAQMFLQVSWNKVYESKGSSNKVTNLQNMVNEMVDIAFPQVTTKISLNDKPYITSEIKKLDRARKKDFFK